MKFYSPNRNLKVLLKREEYANYGGLMSLAKSPEFAQFTAGFFTTEDPEVIELLKKSREYSDLPDISKSFWPYKDPVEEAAKQKAYIESLEQKAAEVDSLKKELAALKKEPTSTKVADKTTKDEKPPAA